MVCYLEIKDKLSSMPLENSQTQSVAVYGADQSNYGYDTSQTYYQVFICDSLFCVMQLSQLLFYCKHCCISPSYSNVYFFFYPLNFFNAYRLGNCAITNIFIPSQTPSQVFFVIRFIQYHWFLFGVQYIKFLSNAIDLLNYAYLVFSIDNCINSKVLPGQMHTLLPSLQVLSIRFCPEL